MQNKWKFGSRFLELNINHIESTCMPYKVEIIYAYMYICMYECMHVCMCRRNKANQLGGFVLEQLMVDGPSPYNPFLTQHLSEFRLENNEINIYRTKLQKLNLLYERVLSILAPLLAVTT